MIYLPVNASKARLREAENARRNRADMLKALADGTIRRRDLIKWGLVTAAGTLAMKNGLSPFARSAYADSNIPTGAPLLYELDDSLRAVRHRYLGDPEAAARRAAAVGGEIERR